ncbi:DUF6114 domain-containing protein [Actinoplanes sp. NPDC049316]|uniref:DUF6114 domain-containing protein n=1 Tax=Actinoplanes sp. NPDC049316 TaxID=3154727 RepID=UPI00342942CA
MAPPSTPPGGFRLWRRSRPFWGGLLLVLAGLELFLSANLTLGDLQVHFGPQGFLSYLLPLILLLCGVLTWVSPGQRLFYGILGLLTAVYTLIGLNFGGFGLGMLLGIFGGALVLAWSPARPQPEVPIPADVAETRDPDDTAPLDGASSPGAELPYGAPPEEEDLRPYPAAPDEARPDDTAVLRPANGSGLVPGFSSDGMTPAPDDPEQPPRSSGGYRKAFVITLVPLVVTTAVLVAGGRTPARADNECPEGLPSRSVAAAGKESAKQSPAAAKARAKTQASAKAVKKSAAPAAAATKSSPAKADEPEEDDPSKSSNPIVDGWNGLVDGVGDLLGIGDDETAEPSASASPSVPPADPSTPATSAPATEGPSAPAPQPSGEPSADPSGSSAGSASPSPAPSSSDIPCLGPRVFKEAGPDDVPQVSLKGGTLETDRLTMYNSTYDGVAELPTAEGTIKALKFSMDKAVNKPFKLTIAERGGATTLIKSNELTTDGNVRFYTPRFEGKLFGLIPVVFTPDSPPPLTLPVLWFTDVTINLAFVRCDTLTADPLDLSEKS